MQQPSLAVIGCGNIAQFHLNAFASLKARVAVLSDVRPEATADWAQRLGARQVPDWRQAVLDREVNTVVICGWSTLHYEIARFALESGRHVICEKTLTCSAAESADLARTAQQQNLQLYTSYMKRFFPAVRRAKELMPRLGRLMAVHLRTHQPSGSCFDGDPAGYFATGPEGTASSCRRSAGGGVLTCAGSHVLDLMLHLAGKPAQAFGQSYQRREHDVEILFHGLLTWDDGACGHLDCSWHPHQAVGFEGRGWDEHVEIIGTLGRLLVETPTWNRPDRAAARLAWYDDASATWSSPVFDSIDPFTEAERSFLMGIANGRQDVDQDPWTGYRVDQVIETLTQSAKENRPLHIPWVDLAGTR